MKLELMAPVKNYECLVEAIKSGADSVYLGIKKFNARIYAENLDISELIRAIKYAHSQGKKIYLALNTLIKDTELEEVIEYANIAIAAGIDAIIIQDLGLFVHLARLGIPLIASTQMNICNSRGVSIAKELGFHRVVLARELNIHELHIISQKTNGIELECFIHGGLCIGYSGQCYLSSYFENLAANRGVCKTPCWENYTLYCDEVPIDSGRLLKPKDMYGIHHIPQLSASGINAFKIQGRTRTLNYVCSVVSIYREFIDKAIKSDSVELLPDTIDLLCAQSPRGLMRGNLELSVNNSFVVEGKCSKIKKRKYKENNSFCQCGKAKHIAVCFNEISHINTKILFCNIERIYLPFDLFIFENINIINELKAIAPIYVILPTLIERYDISVETLENLIKQFHIDGISLSNIGDLLFVDMIDCNFSAEHTFNICNMSAVNLIREKGIKSVTLPFELSESECRLLTEKMDYCFERVVYGRPPLIKMKYCLLAKTNECINCGKCVSSRKITLWGKYSFFVKIYASRNETVLYPVRKLALPVYENESNLVRFEFIDENTSQINTILSAYSEGYYPEDGFGNVFGSI